MADTVVKEAKEALRLSYEFDRDNRTQAIEDLRFVAGFQWSDQARTEREGRPIITINRSGQFIRQVANPIRQNMPTLKVEPDGDDQKQMADLANGMMRRIQYNSSASHVYANAVEHMVACGIGWFRVTSDYCDDTTFNQEILIKRVFNPLSVYPDPDSLEPDRSNMNFCNLSEVWTREAFKKKWPKASVTGIDGAPNQDSSIQGVAWGTADGIRVSEFWQRSETAKKLHQMSDGSVLNLDEVPPELHDQIKPHIVNERAVKGYEVTMTLVSGNEVLEEAYTCPCKWIPIIPVIGAEIPLDRGVYRHGLIRFQREPQMLHNYFMSVAAETLAAQPKSPFMVPAKLIERFKGIWDKHNTVPTPYLPYDPDPENPGLKPERSYPAPLPAGMIQMAQMLADDMKATTGIYDAALGNKSNETSGVAIDARVQQGDQATFHFVDNLEHGLEHLGRVMLDMMGKVYDTKRRVKVMDAQETEQTVDLNVPVPGGEGQVHNDMSKMSFTNVQVILGPNFQSRRREAQAQLTGILQAVPEIAQVGGDIIVRQYDFEGADDLADRLKAVLPPQVQALLKQKEQEKQQQDGGPPQPPSPQEQQAAQAQQAQQQAMEAQAKAATDKDEASARLSNAQARLVEAQQLATYGYLIPPGEPAPDGSVAQHPRMLPPTDPVKAAQAAKIGADHDKTIMDTHKVIADTRNAHAQADAAHLNNALTVDQADEGNHPSQQPPEPPAQVGQAA